VHLAADLHTHTTASGHAYSTVAELATTASRRGMELIAITDHGPALAGASHDYHFRNLKALPCEIDGVRVLKGVEANVMGTAGELDLPEDVLARLDFVAAGFHPGCGFDERDEDLNTRALVGVVANPLVDMITHPGNRNYPVRMEDVVAAAKEYDVIVELNDFTFAGNGSRKGSEEHELEFARAAHDAGARIAISSDAHFHSQVGLFEGAGPFAREAGLVEADFINHDAVAVTEYLLSRRERPWWDVGGTW
jgi:putative hydrolase